MRRVLSCEIAVSGSVGTVPTSARTKPPLVRTARAFVVAVLMFVVAACSGTPEWGGTIEERDGVMYVHSPAEGLWDGEGGRTVRFELEQTFGADTEPPEAILNGIYRQAFDVDDEGNVYIFDGGDDRLVSFAPDGSFRWSGGGPGQGPGELGGAEGMAWNGADLIYVTNGRGARVDSWTTEGEFVESRSISHLDYAFGSLVGVLDEHTIVLQTGSEAPAGVRVGVIDLRGEGSKVADFEVDVTSGTPSADSPGAVMEVEIVNGSIAVGDWDSYDLRFYDREGNLERVVSRAFDHMVQPVSREENRANNGVNPSSWLKPPLPLADGRMLALASWTDPAAIERLRALPERPPFEEVLEAYRLSLDLFDQDGRYLTSSVVGMNDMGIPDEVDREGKLYTSVSDPYPHVRRYRVVIGDGGP